MALWDSSRESDHQQETPVNAFGAAGP